MSYTWIPGTAPTAAQLNAEIRDETIDLCTLAPDTRPVGVADGKTVCTIDTGQYWRWEALGAGWRDVTWWSWKTWTPSITQGGGALAITGGQNAYHRVGKRVVARCAVVLGAAGSAGQEVQCSLPVAAVFPSPAAHCVGTWTLITSVYWVGAVLLVDTSKIVFAVPTAPSLLGPNGTTLAAGSAFSFTIEYEAAA